MPHCGLAHLRKNCSSPLVSGNIQTAADVRCRTRAPSDVRIDVARRTINSCPVELRDRIPLGEPGSGCPFAALCCEMPRQSRGARERFTAGVRSMIARLSGRMESRLKPRQREEKAMATIASQVGALVLARAVNDPKLSDDILRATRNRLSD